MNSNTESKWQKIRLAGLTRLIHAPLALRWRWTTDLCHGRKRMLLVSPRGARWLFRLNRGAWLQRVPAEPPAHP